MLIEINVPYLALGKADVTSALSELILSLNRFLNNAELLNRSVDQNAFLKNLPTAVLNPKTRHLIRVLTVNSSDETPEQDSEAIQDSALDVSEKDATSEPLLETKCSLTEEKSSEAVPQNSISYEKGCAEAGSEIWKNFYKRLNSLQKFFLDYLRCTGTASRQKLAEVALFDANQISRQIQSLELMAKSLNVALPYVPTEKTGEWIWQKEV